MTEGDCKFNPSVHDYENIVWHDEDGNRHDVLVVLKYDRVDDLYTVERFINGESVDIEDFSALELCAEELAGQTYCVWVLQDKLDAAHARLIATKSSYGIVDTIDKTVS